MSLVAEWRPRVTQSLKGVRVKLVDFYQPPSSFTLHLGQILQQFWIETYR